MTSEIKDISENVSAEDFLRSLIEAKDRERLEATVGTIGAEDLVRGFDRLSPDEREQLLYLLSPETAAVLLEELPDSHVTEVLENLDAEDAAHIVDELDSDDQADVINNLDREDAEAILAEMDPQDAADVRRLVAYSSDQAGGLMVTEYLSVVESATTGDLLEDLARNAEQYRSYDTQYIYVVAVDRTLQGVLPLRRLLLSPRSETIKSLMNTEVVSVPDDTTLDQLESFFERNSFYGVPVLSKEKILVGVVHRSAVYEALAEQSEGKFLRSKGIIGGEELRSMPLGTRTFRRSTWLAFNLVLNIMAASVIVLYEETLQAVIALAVFLPIISDMSGCAGYQAVAVTMRELSLGVVQVRDVARVCLKELSVGISSGLILGILLAFVAWLWKGSIVLGLVVGIALVCNTLIAVVSGGCIPLVLRRFGFDPALASGPILTTLTDVCGFFFTLAFAAMALPWLAGV